VLTEHDPGLSPEKSAKSTLCLDAALLCSRVPVGMRDAARAAWVAILRCCRLPGADGRCQASQIDETEPAVVLRIYLMRCGRGSRRDHLLALVARGVVEDKAIACGAASRSGRAISGVWWA